MNAYTLFKDQAARNEASNLPDRDSVLEAARSAADRIAPVWPLKHSVAVNPYLGLIDQPFEQAAGYLGRSCGSKLTHTADVYKEAQATGRLNQADLETSFKAADLNPEAADLAADLEAEADAPALFQSFTDHLSEHRDAALPAFVTERISQWAMAHFDTGQAIWPGARENNHFDAWRECAAVDRTVDLAGYGELRALFGSLPRDPYESIGEITRAMGIPALEVPAYFDRLLMSINGWAAYARYLSWQAMLEGNEDDSVIHMLAIRLAWDWALWTLSEETEQTSWLEFRNNFPIEIGTELTAEQLVHNAYEIGWQRELISKINQAPQRGEKLRPAAQAVFCIDVRSEVYRRALEAAMPTLETIGFAGFFGAAIEYVPLGGNSGGKQCPVLLSPAYRIQETTGVVAEDERLAERKRVDEAVVSAFRSLRAGAVSSFAFVETLGFGFAGRLISDTLGWTRPTADPAHRSLGKSQAMEAGPSLDGTDGRGVPLEDRANLALGMLKGMSLTENFGRLVLLTGHTGESVNNPHASGLDCGACGGHGGQANARLAVKLLNDRDVRQTLTERGIDIPDDTVFVGAEHNTTTDDVTMYDLCCVPSSHKADIDALKTALKTAGATARAERMARLNLRSDTDHAVRRKSNDWSEVRPEWGLAGCAAFIAAPRDRTADISLEGRSFLHSYEADKDTDGGVLELIMTAPMVVASWISLQYYASTVDNQTFGCGQKPLHNVVSKLGVLEGNVGDLRTGLPWQSIHNGERYMHEPLRLNVIIEASTDAMNTVIAKHEMVRHLVDNRWLHLYAMESDGRIHRKYAGGLKWEAV